MRLSSFEYSELHGTPGEWTARPFNLEKVNLFVGRNASGKSRLLSVMANLANLINAPINPLVAAGQWACTFDAPRQRIEVSIKVAERRVLEEKVTINGATKLTRLADGTGDIWAEEEKKAIRFKVPASSLVLLNRRDEIQHPYLEPLFRWAAGVRLYSFVHEFGNRFHLHTMIPEEGGEQEGRQAVGNAANAIQTYIGAYQKYGDKLDVEILKDFSSIGFDCESVDAEPVVLPGLRVSSPNQFAVGLKVKERDLPGPTMQAEMSAGMFRALAFLIHLNAVVLGGEKPTIFVDDIGEGLDFERARLLVKLLIKKCVKHGIQIIMSTNDRFIMNEVDLEYWHVVNRKKNVVEILDYKNSKDVFDEFKFLGLSNFEFFSRKMYLESEK